MEDNRIDGLAILVCQIKVWSATAPNWWTIPDIYSCLYLHEVESIEVTESYKDLLGRCVIRFPRGTIVSKLKKPDSITTGNQTDFTKEKNLNEATLNGDSMVPGSGIYDNGMHTTPIQAIRDDIGIIQVSRGGDAHIATPNDFAIGNRIQIRCGYVYNGELMQSEDGNMYYRSNPYRAEQIINEDNPPELKMIFTGIITGCSVTSPLEIECENMASVLKKTSCKNLVTKGNYKVNDFFKSDGNFRLLENTGITLAPASRNMEIEIGKVDISENNTVADVITSWQKAGVMAFMENFDNGMSMLRIGKAYYNGGGGLQASDHNYISYNDGVSAVTIIYGDYDVAEDNLQVSRIDKQFLAIVADGKTTDDKAFKLTLRKSPSMGADKTDAWDIINERTVRPKKKLKSKNGTVIGQKLKSKVDLSKYMTVQYHSHSAHTPDALAEEAKVYWKAYSPNGVSGSITIFGDKLIKPADVIGIVDKRQPEKNGYYIVESVTTRFGVDGFRRELKLPYRLMGIDIKEKTIK